MTLAAAAPRAITGAQKALMYALSGLARSGATRSNYVSTNAFMSIGGIWTGATASRRVLISSLTIHDLLNETPNTCTFTIQGDRPLEGAEVVIAYGSTGNSSRAFGGNVLRVTEVYVGQNPNHVLWQVECIDYTWRLNSRLVVARYLTTSAATIAADLVARFAPAGFTVSITDELPVIDEISFTNTPLMEALTQVAARIGGYAQCDYQRVVTLWLTDSGILPIPLTAAHPSLEDIAYTRDLSQIVTRAIVEGGGVNMLADVGPGTPILPVEDVTWYPPNGGLVACGPQRIRYTGVVAGGAGALVEVSGAALTPSVAPSYTQTEGAGLPVGQYDYAYTWTTGSGETTVSPFVRVNLAATASIPNPTVNPVVNATNLTGSLTPGVFYYFGYQYTEDAGGPPAKHTKRSTAIAQTSQYGAVNLYVPYSSDPAVKFVHVIRWPNPFVEGQGRYSHYFANNTALAGQYHAETVTGPTDAAIASNPAFTDTTNNTGGQGGQITLTGIATGPSGTTGRKVYRTQINASQLQFHTTIANNSSTTMAVDTKADASLGANAPTSNSSGLTGASGVVVANSTSIPVTGTAGFPTSGWARIGSLMIRYVGKTAGALTGIPPYGSGSLTATIQHGTEVIVAPQIVGLPAPGQPGCVLVGIKAGDPVNLIVIVDDPIAQSALSALLGGDGVIEGFLSDNRISQTEALARAYALLEQKKNPQEQIRYRCRDPLSRSGATITVSLPAPVAISATFKIQDVTISRFIGTGTHYPVYDVVASTARFTFEDLLRQARTRTRTQPH